MINNTVLPRVSLILSITFYFSPRKKKSEDTKGVIRSYKLKETKYDCQKKKIIGQPVIYKALHRKLKIEQHEPHKKSDELRCS
jgi:hypothetical protein